MFEILPESTEKCVGFKISGEVEAEDYELLLPKLDAAIAAHGKINLLVVMDDYEGFDGLEAAKADFKFGTQQYRQVEKAAFVSDKKWLGRMVKVMDPLHPQNRGQIFDPGQIEAAWTWILADD